MEALHADQTVTPITPADPIDDDDRAVDAMVEAALRVAPDDPRRETWLADGLDLFIDVHLAEDESRPLEASRRRDYERAFLEDHVRPLIERAQGE